MLLLKDASDRASSDSGESAESAVTDTSSKEVDLERQSASSELEKPCESNAIVQNTASPSLVPTEVIFSKP